MLPTNGALPAATSRLGAGAPNRVDETLRGDLRRTSAGGLIAAVTRAASTPSSGAQLGERDVLERIAADLGKSASELSRLKKLVGVLTSVAFAYVLGGVVLALRLDVAGFPVRDGLQVIPPQSLLFIGVRELVLSGLVAAILVGLTLALAAVPLVSRRILIVVPALLAIVVPLNAGGLAWPLALLAIGAALLGVWHRYEVDPTYRVGFLPVVAVPLLAVTAVTLGRYMVPPNEFPIATVRFKAAAATPLHPPVIGGFLASTSDYVYVAQRDRGDTSPDEAAIDAFARDSVLSVRLTRRPEEVDPRGSLFAAVTGIDIAVTPWLDLWVNDDQKGLQVFH